MTHAERVERAKTATDWREATCGYCVYNDDGYGDCMHSPPIVVPGQGTRYPPVSFHFLACAKYERAGEDEICRRTRAYEKGEAERKAFVDRNKGLL